MFPRHENLQISKTQRVASRQNSSSVNYVPAGMFELSEHSRKMRVEMPGRGSTHCPPAAHRGGVTQRQQCAFHHIARKCSAVAVEEKIYFLSLWLTAFQSQLPAITESIMVILVTTPQSK